MKGGGEWVRLQKLAVEFGFDASSLATKVSSKVRWGSTLRTIGDVLVESRASLHIDTLDEDLPRRQIHGGDVIGLELLP